MATQSDIDTLRRFIGDTDPSNQLYTDEFLGDLIDSLGSVNKAALSIWEGKAATAVELVTVSESGSSRSNGEIFKNAQQMIAYFRGLVDKDEPPEPIRHGSYTRRIERD